MSKKPDVKTLLAKKKKAPAGPPQDPNKCPKCGSGLVQTRTTRMLACKNYTCDYFRKMD